MFRFRVRFIHKALLCVILASTLAACDSLNLIDENAGDENADRAAASLSALRLQPGDKLKVTVFGEDKLTGDYAIDPGGSLSLPLAGTVQAAGLTKAELERLLTKKLAAQRYLINPKVTVDIADFRPFYVLGEVEKPGEYPYKSGLNISSALAIAGGTTYRASSGKVLIQRDGTKKFVEMPFSPSIMIFPGDVVKIPERYF